jgi:hypothetical protein
MRQAPRSRWIGWLALLAFLAAGSLTPWLEGVATAQAMAVASDAAAPPPCHEPCKGPGCVKQTVCVAKCLQGPMLAVASWAGVGAATAVFCLAPSPTAAARVIQPQTPPPRA